MYGDHVTLFDSLVITVFSMAVVFAALWILTYISDVTKIFVERGAKKKEVAKKAETVADNSSVEVEEEEDELELVAVITAAIVASTGKNPNSFVVKNIRRTSSRETAWATQGRIDNMR